MRFLLALFFILAHLSQAQTKPNVLMIVVDDLGYGDLSSYGATDLQSPHIDDLLAQGLRFTQFYANCPVCSPTRASLLTGCYPDLVGVPGVIRTSAADNWGHLSRSATLLPQALNKQGYATAAIGKWHLGLEAEDHPNARGFDHFHGFLGDMMDDYYHHRRHENNYMRLNQEMINPEGHATDLFTDWANAYLDSRAKKSEEPFFLYLAYNAPHTPIQPPADWLEKVRNREAGITDKRARLVALIEHMDAGIGRVIATLKKNGQWEKTLTLFVSDNGGQTNVGANCGKLRGGKQDMYEGGIRVPAGAVWPGVTPVGTSDFQGITMDFFTTVLDAADSEQPAGIDGQSLLPLLKTGQQDPIERDLFWVRREGNERYMGESSWAMRRGPWKLVKNSPMKPWELFNLDEDPLETTDLATKNRPKFRELAQGMRARIQRGGAIPWQGK